MGNKQELAQMRKKIAFYDVIQIDRLISEKAIELLLNLNSVMVYKFPTRLLLRRLLVTISGFIPIT